MPLSMVKYAAMLVMIALVCNAMPAELSDGSCDNHDEDARSQLGQRSLIQSKGLEKVEEAMSEESNKSHYDYCPMTKKSHDWFWHGKCGGCVGRNELGKHRLSLPACKRKCLDDSFCVSFEFRRNDPDCPQRDVSFSSAKRLPKCCQLSRTCTYTSTVRDPYDDFDYYEKDFPKLSSCKDTEIKLGGEPSSRAQQNSGKCVKISKQQTCGWGTKFQEKATGPRRRRWWRQGMHLYYKDKSQTELCLNALSSKWGSDVTLLCKDRQCFVDEGKN